ncbi:MAG: proton-conducting transporter membrane subunit, partial [Pseudomonadota bacterium]|nr:proton-conducting transporter membrane subunit [Pseudomonadota bacterium]
MFVFQMADIMPALPEIFLAAVALVLVLVAAYGGETAVNARRVTQLAMAGIVIALLLVINSDQVITSAFGGMFSADSFAGFMKALVLLGTFAALAMSIRTSGDDDIKKPEYSLLILLALIGMMLMISADNLMALYMGVELQSLPLYVVAAMRTSSLRSSEAGLKYFLL